jgi:acetyl esterase/lipase/3-dehydroquinate dehydratase
VTTRIVVVPGPGLDGPQCTEWGKEAGVDVDVRPGDPTAVLGALAAGRDDRPAGVVIGPGADGFDAAALADAIGRAGIPVVVVEPENLRKSGIQPERTRLAAAGATVLYGRGPDTVRYGLAFFAHRLGQTLDTLAYGPDPSQEGDLWCPAGGGPHPVAVLFHGGFWYHAWERDLMDGLARDLARRGVAAWNVEYRRVGAGGGWPATGEDAARAVDHLVALAPVYGLDLDRVALIGHSAGATLGLWVAARGRRGEVHPALVVGLATIADLEAAAAERIGGGSVARLLGGDLDVALGDASPRARLPIGVPQLLAHAADDDVVPIAQTIGYAAAAEAAGDDVTVVRFERGGHFDLIDPASPAWINLGESLEARL